MKVVSSVISAAFIVAGCLVVETLFSYALFYAMTFYTQIPVDNNSLWVGCCILMGCIGIMLGLFAIVGEGNDHKKHNKEVQS